MSRAAQEGGWQPTWCCHVENARELAERRRLQLAIIDMEDALGAVHSAICQLSERLAARDGPLMMICGNEDNPTEEIWARELGAWLYLPGVDEDCDLVSLCGEALGIVQKEEQERGLELSERGVIASGNVGRSGRRD